MSRRFYLKSSAAGVSLVESGLLILLVSVGISVSVSLLGNNVDDHLNYLSCNIESSDCTDLDPAARNGSKANGAIRSSTEPKREDEETGASAGSTTSGAIRVAQPINPNSGNNGFYVTVGEGASYPPGGGEPASSVPARPKRQPNHNQYSCREKDKDKCD